MNAVQCDYCGKFAPNPSHRFGRELLPADWFRAGAWKGGNPESQTNGTDQGDFCSRECIAAHFAKPANHTFVAMVG